MLKKKCRACGYTKPHYQYYRERRYPPTALAGYTSECRQCLKSRHGKYYTRNSEKIKKQVKKYDRINSESRNLRVKKWVVNNPDCRLMIARKSRAKRRANEKGIISTVINYEYIIDRDCMICYLCQQIIADSDLHFDHLIPLSRGGRHTTRNLRCTHSWCNLRKSDNLIEELDWVVVYD